MLCFLQRLVLGKDIRISSRRKKNGLLFYYFHFVNSCFCCFIVFFPRFLQDPHIASVPQPTLLLFFPSSHFTLGECIILTHRNIATSCADTHSPTDNKKPKKVSWYDLQAHRYHIRTSGPPFLHFLFFLKTTSGYVGVVKRLPFTCTKTEFRVPRLQNPSHRFACHTIFGWYT